MSDVGMNDAARFAADADDRVLADALCALGMRYDAAPRFPKDSLRALAGHGLHRRFAPIASGGTAFADEEARYAALHDALRFVGRCDLSVGRLFEGHINALLLYDWYGTDSQQAWLGQQLERGAWFGVWATEPPPGVRIRTEDGKAVLTGEKSFASGAGGLDYAVVTAAPEEGHRRMVVVAANEAVRADLSGWRVRGMRASVSGRYDLSAYAVDRQALLGKAGDYDRDPRFTAGAWRFCAVQLGGIEALLIEARAGMRDAFRQDPVQRARFADAVIAMRTAGMWTAHAAQAAAREEADAVPLVRMTRSVVEQAGFAVMEAAARLIGTRSSFDGERIDKIMRDLSLYLRQSGNDHARDEAGKAFLDRDCWSAEDRLW